MAAFPTVAWVKKAKLLPPVGKNWKIQFHLLASGKMPTDFMQQRSTNLWTMIGRDIFWVVIQHDGKQDSIGLGIEMPWRRHRNELRLPNPQLAKLGPWVASAEKKFGTQFRRDKVWVRSNVKGGRDAVVAWIQNGYKF